MARNFPPKISFWHSGLLAQSRDQVEIQEVRPRKHLRQDASLRDAYLAARFNRLRQKFLHRMARL